MELSEEGRLGQQPRPQRPPIYSQHSNSVPSTPYQRPRDLRFHSRSPSPNRGLGNQSPRSVLSEAVGPYRAQRSTPVVCKFETGAEIRKRRIPYVDGGNEELGPPRKEPKKSLEPDEHEILSGDMRELYDRLLPSQESEERRALLVKKLEKILNEEWPGNDIRVHVFGSSGNDLSSSDSDVDICIKTPLKKLESMHAIATLLDKNGMQKVVCRASAKVPIVKCWDPELKLAADLNVNNTLALENTRMIKTYVQLDERVRPLAKIIKYWTKRRILNDAAFGGTISSYTWICMIISFLQRRNPPIVPSLQKTAESAPSDAAGDMCKFADDVDKLKGFGDANKETLPELLFQFFRHYGYEFEYSKYVVSIREGRLLSRREKGWDPSNWQDKEARNRLCVEEPFTTNRNLGNSADDYAWSGIHGEIRRAFDLLADGGQLEKCCEQYEFPPEEKPIFQRPAPKPKPTLTRSASQSGRPNHEQGSGRSRKGGNRNQSSQRSSNRRASSGAAFGNQRVTLGFPSPLGGPMMDYFAAKGELHNHLYQQYQLLQAQQEALQRQLHQSAQAQAQSHGRSSEANGSPLHRAHTNGLTSPRFVESAPPQTAPLLPGYLYHYPARYPPPSPMSQARSREGSSTNPSSPSMAPAQPTLRRQVQRGSLPDGSSGSIRSQSQPGRSLPHPLTLQQQTHPGYDVSGALGGQYPSGRASQGYPSGHIPLQMPFSPLGAGYPTAQSVDSAMPKEYIGYYVGQSPSLGPQFATASQMQMPPMTLRDSPLQRPRRVTPDLMPPLPNGLRTSRSPSPLSTTRSHSIAEDMQTVAQPPIFQSPGEYSAPPVPAPVPGPASLEIDTGGPVIVNGSNPSPARMEPTGINGILGSAPPTTEPIEKPMSENEPSQVQSLPLRTSLDAPFVPEQVESSDTTPSSPRMPPSPKTKSAPKLTLLPNGAPQTDSPASEPYHHESTPAPLLSPVAELRTPSPTLSITHDKDSPRADGWAKAAKLANAKQAERVSETGLSLLPSPTKRNENLPPLSPTTRQQPLRPGSAPGPTPVPKTQAIAKSPTSTTIPVAPPTAAAAAGGGGGAGAGLKWDTNAAVNQNPWQQATRKGHKKSKSAGAAKSFSALGASKEGSGMGQGQPLPASEAERKGG